MKGKYIVLLIGIVLLIFLGYVFLFSPFDRKPASRETRIIRIKNIEWVMVYIPAGQFQMGSKHGWKDEQPVHKVKITTGFWVGQTEVTQGLWEAVMGKNPSAFSKGDQYPVERVSWADCQQFIDKLNQMTGLVFRFPTEAEWEYACRAGEGSDIRESLNNLAWYKENAGESTHPVGKKKANAFGLYDMLGNVWEWCSDWYDENYYARSPINDPLGAGPGIHRVDRGGGWAYEANIVKPTRRDGSGPDYATNLIGFRLAATHLNRVSEDPRP